MAEAGKVRMRLVNEDVTLELTDVVGGLERRTAVPFFTADEERTAFFSFLQVSGDRIGHKCSHTKLDHERWYITKISVEKDLYELVCYALGPAHARTLSRADLRKGVEL